MLKLVQRYLFVLMSWALFACSGERYDTSKALYILPERAESLIPDSTIASVSVHFNDNLVYGTFKPEKVVTLHNLISNYEIQDGVVYYVDSNLHLVGMDLLSRKRTLEVPLFQKKGDIKKDNVSFASLEIGGSNAVISLNNGHFMGVDIDTKSLMWAKNLKDMTFNSPEIIENEALLLSDSSVFYGFDVKTGKELFQTKGDEDITGTNFIFNKRFKPLTITQFNILLSYYRTDVLFFDFTTGTKVFSMPLIDGALEFGRMYSEPVIVKNLLISGTSRNLTAVSFANAIKLWEINANIASNILVAGNHIFAFDATSKSLLCIDAIKGTIKWKEMVDLKKLSKMKLFASSDYNIIAFTENGRLLKFDAQTGNKIFQSENDFYSSDFDYSLVNGKIHYINEYDQLVILN